MRFLSESQLELAYGKPFEEISPTDRPLAEYITGETVVECPECNKELQSNCKQIYTEVAYCEECKIQLKRNREPKYTIHCFRVDEREEYICKSCNETHPIMDPPSTGFTHNRNPVISSLEDIKIGCPCGSYQSIGRSVKLPQTIHCTDCYRSVTIQPNIVLNGNN